MLATLTSGRYAFGSDDDDLYDYYDDEEEFIELSPEEMARMEEEDKEKERLIAQAREARAKRDLLKEQMKGYGEFYFLFYDDGFFEKLSNADLARLLFLASYMPYSDKGYVLQSGRRNMRKDECAKILRLSSKAFYNFWNLCEANGFLSANENNEVVISKKYFRRGNRNKTDFKSREFVRINIVGIRHLYVTTKARAHKQLGYLYRLIPKVDAQHNIVCSNPEELSLAAIEDMTMSELAAFWKYHVSNFSRLKNELLSFKLESGEKALMFIENDKGGQRIIVNPKLFYAGNDYRSFLVAGTFGDNT